MYVCVHDSVYRMSGTGGNEEKVEYDAGLLSAAVAGNVAGLEYLSYGDV